MRNLWKGLVIGGLTGVAAGIVVDLGESGWQSIGRAARRAQRHAPAAAGRMKATGASGSGRVEDAVAGVAGKVEPSKIAERAVSTAERVADMVNEKVGAGHGT